VLRLPALRDRREDLPALADAVLEPHRRRRGDLVLGREALEALRHHPWPGNFRELRNRLEQAAAACSGGEIRVEHLALEEALPGVPEASCGPALSRWEQERQSIRAALFGAEAPAGLPETRPTGPAPVPPPAFAAGSPAPSALYARLKSLALTDLTPRQRAG
jgi:DNA-binding NtrC family response regulator